MKYSRSGGEVRVGWERRDDVVRFSVADDGIGVPESHQERIFERFYKGRPVARLRNIAEAHGGSVGLTSEEGVGSTFWIEVPVAS